jgi:hypothetical protein
MLKLCTRCDEKLGLFRFETGSQICRDCQRLPEPRTIDERGMQAYNRSRYKATVNALAKEPGYKAYLEENSLRCAQFGSVGMRGCGWTDK